MRSNTQRKRGIVPNGAQHVGLTQCPLCGRHVGVIDPGDGRKILRRHHARNSYRPCAASLTAVEDDATLIAMPQAKDAKARGHGEAGKEEE